MPKRKPIEARELLASLQSDPEYVARRNEQERRMEDTLRRTRAEQVELLGELRTAGVLIEDVWDLVNSSQPYAQAIPVLLKHLVRAYSDTTKEGIARSLAVPEAQSAWPIIVAEYKATNSADDRGYKDGLAVALSCIVSDATMEEYLAILGDRRHGTSRVFLLRKLKRGRRTKYKQIIQELIQDPDLATEILSW